MPKSKHRNKKLRKPKIVKWKVDDGILNIPVSPKPLLEIPRPKTNSRMEFTYMRGFPATHPESKKLRLLTGSKSIYKITYVFSIPGINSFKDRLDFKKFSKNGESSLKVPIGETVVIYWENEQKEQVEIWFESNSKGALSNALLRIPCNNFQEAEKVAHELVSTILSYWSYLYDVGIEMSSYEILEENTGTLKYSVGLIGEEKSLIDNTPFKLLPEYRRIFASYREAMNSSSPFYQLLCFFKVTEGLISIRQKAIKKNRPPLRKGEQGFEQDEFFPTDLASLPVEDEITKLAFNKYLGKSFQEVRNKIKDDFRHSIAHLLEFENVIDADRYDDVIKCSQSISILIHKCNSK